MIDDPMMSVIGSCAHAMVVRLISGLILFGSLFCGSQPRLAEQMADIFGAAVQQTCMASSGVLQQAGRKIGSQVISLEFFRYDVFGTLRTHETHLGGISWWFQVCVISTIEKRNDDH